MNRIRVALPTDAESILAIYAPYIINTSFTFETEVPSVEAFEQRINSYLANWPWLVCEVDGVFAGYAYATRHRERTAYQWSVESSVYIHDDFQKTGIATVLYKVLLEILKRQGLRNVYAGINLPNDRSVAFHEKCGFKWFANYENVGYKLGKWKTVGWWVKQLNDYTYEPLAPIKFADLHPTFKELIF
ncbi:MAG: arsinothricin resistance N-acetyltransferase ArsN1 family B [Ginsengibacter sp.]